MRSRLLAAATVGACLLASGASQAAIISHTFAAELVDTYGPDGAGFPTRVTGRFAYDTSVADDDEATPNHAYYTGAAVGLALEGYFEPTAFDPPRIYADARVTDDSIDTFTWAAGYDIGGGVGLLVAFETIGPPGVFSSDALPTALPLDQFTSAKLFLGLIGAGNGSATFQLTSLVPTEVPEPVGLFGVALLGLLGLSRRRRTRA